MRLFRKEPGPPRPRFFRPFYLLIVWGLVAGLLVVNGTHESQRAQSNLYQMLSDEGGTLISGLEKNAQSIFFSLAALENLPAATPLIVASPINFLELEDAVVDLVLGGAFQIDREMGRRPVQEVDVSKILKREHFSAVEVIPGADESASRPTGEKVPQYHGKFYQPLLEGKAEFAIERKEKNGSGQMGHLSVAVMRKAGRGIVVVRAEEGELRFFRRRVILQGLIDEWIGKGDTKYIVFQGQDGEIWADTDAEKIGRKEEVAFAAEIWQKEGSRPHSRRESGTLEVAQVVSLDRNTRTLVRVGLSAVRVEQMVAADRRNIILFSLLLLAFGGVGVAFIYRMQNRHLGKIREMEEKIHQSERISSLANLAAGVAHEIRNPLNAIGMAIQRLQREFAPESAESQKEYFQFTDVLRGEVGRVNDIIEQFLFFARPARLELKPVQIGDLLRHLLLLCEENARQQQVTLEENVQPDLPVLQLDRGRIQEALLNLINNGLQAMPAGGRLVTEASRQDGKVLIQISDSGEGISEENLGRIFDYYFTTKEKGMGLGLPLAHKIIRDHGGSIEVQSAIGRGTTFRVYLPVRGEKE